MCLGCGLQVRGAEYHFVHSGGSAGLTHHDAVMIESINSTHGREEENGRHLKSLALGTLGGLNSNL